MLEAFGVEGKEGETLTLSRRPDRGGLELRRVDVEFEEMLAKLRDTMKRCKNTLRELAK